MWTATDRRIGIRAATGLAVLGLVYIAVGLAGVLMRPAGLPMLAQVDPFLAILELLVFASALLLVVLVAVLGAYAAEERRTNARVALALTTAFATITSASHFLSLTVGRQAAGGELAVQLSHQWLSLNLALDLLAWDLLLGFALIAAAPIFGGRGLAAATRRTAVVAGALCLAGSIGPLSGRMELQLVAVAGYAFMLPAWSILVALLFVRTPASAPAV